MDEEITKYEDTNKIFYRNENNKFHNINDEPAIVWKKSGVKRWCKNGKNHRTKGPSMLYPDGHSYWYYEGGHITDKVNQLMEEGRLNSDWRNWTEEDEFLFVLLVS